MEEDEWKKQQEEAEALYLCPSFNSYTSQKFAEFADKLSANETSNELDDDDGDDDEFEFAIVKNNQNDGEIVVDGEIHPIFPIFNRVVVDDVERDRESKPDVSALRIPLKKMFMADRDLELPSSSESDADEFESIPQGTYCVWNPKLVESSPGRCKKSKSTGSASKRWRFLDLLRRSNSEGTEALVFLTPKNAGKVSANGVAAVYGGGEKAATPSSSAHEAFYVRNRALKEGDKRKSYLPYRQDLVGFFANVNGLTKTFPTF